MIILYILTYLRMKTLYKFMAMVALSVSSVASFAQLKGKTAIELRDMMGAGWNVGNSLDAYAKTGLEAETSWGNPKISECLIEKAYQTGFRTIRVPVSWGGHISSQNGYDSYIDRQWLARVKEVVDYGYSRGMFVILNIHHDNGAQNTNTCFFPSTAQKDKSVKYVTEIWTQLADYFADYDQHLIFETLNEPRLVGDSNEWWFCPVDNPQQSQIRDAISVINDMNQAGVNAIRNGKGYNDDRMILVPGYAACPDGVCTNLFKVPEDKTSGRIGLEVHAYRPTELCLTGDRTTFKDADRQTIINEVFAPLSQKYGNTNIPVIIDETSISDKGQGTEERLKWINCYYNLAKEYKMPCVLWDNGTTWETYQRGLKEGWSNPNENGECHGFMNRNSCQWTDETLVNQIIAIIGVPVASDLLTVANDVKIYSVGGMLYVSAENEIDRVRLIDMNGHVLLDKIADSESVEYNVSNVTPGVYAVYVETQGGNKAEMVIVK